MKLNPGGFMRPAGRMLRAHSGSNRLVRPRASPQTSSTTTPTLASQEQQSLTAYLSLAGIGIGIGSSPLAVHQLPPSTIDQLLDTIKRGVSKEVVDLSQLEGAMLLAEQLHYASPGDGLSNAAATAQEVDIWQPIFASSGGFPRLLYIPVPEFFDMHRAVPDATAISISSAASIDISSSRSSNITMGGQHPGAVNIVTELGPITTHFLGDCSWLSDTQFSYSIKKIRIDLAGKSLTLPMPVKLENILTFFLVTPELACARSQLGGTMLLQANPDNGKKYLSAW